MDIDGAKRVERIRVLNDEFRRTFLGGMVVMTSTFAALPQGVRVRVLRLIREFTGFSPDDDPHHEHDFVSVELEGRKFFGKIDYYDLSMAAGSEDPADPDKTKRVLTIMCAEDY
jgi:hypothetical protein